MEEVNAIMEKYNCHFSTQTVYIDGMIISNNVWIVENIKK